MTNQSEGTQGIYVNNNIGDYHMRFFCELNEKWIHIIWHKQGSKIKYTSGRSSNSRYWHHEHQDNRTAADTMKKNLTFSQNVKHKTTTLSSNSTTKYLPRRTKTCVHTKSCTLIFIIAKTWKQPKYLSVGKLISKMWYIYMMEYY